MRILRSLGFATSLAAAVALIPTAAHAQVAVGIGIGPVVGYPAPVYVGGPPRPVLMAITRIIRTPVRLTATMDRTGFMAACLLEPVRGITAGTDDRGAGVMAT